MPRLNSMLRESGTLEIPVQGDDPLRVTYRRDVLTPRLQARMAMFQDIKGGDAAAAGDALIFFCELFSRLIESWNLTDDAGQPIGTDAESLQDVQLEVLTLVAREIGRAMSPDPLTESGSSNGSSQTAGLEPPRSITGS